MFCPCRREHFPPLNNPSKVPQPIQSLKCHPGRVKLPKLSHVIEEVGAQSLSDSFTESSKNFKGPKNSSPLKQKIRSDEASNASLENQNNKISKKTATVLNPKPLSKNQNSGPLLETVSELVSIFRI